MEKGSSSCNGMSGRSFICSANEGRGKESVHGGTESMKDLQKL